MYVSNESTSTDEKEMKTEKDCEASFFQRHMITHWGKKEAFV
jgi:hypothetical protein